MKHERIHQYSPPKAEARGSNPFGCTSNINDIAGENHSAFRSPICDASQNATVALTLADIQCRLQLAQELADAIGQAHPDDAVQLMAAALADLTPAGSRPDFFLDAEADAAWWASLETPEVLVTVLRVALENLGNRAMHRDTRKRLFMTLWRGFTPEDQSRFLSIARGKT